MNMPFRRADKQCDTTFHLSGGITLMRVKTPRTPLSQPVRMGSYPKQNAGTCATAVLAGFVWLAACQPSSTPPRATEIAEPPALPLTASVKDLMGGIIAFSAHVVKRLETSDLPLSASDWNAARLAASDLAASATLLTTSNANILDALRRRDEAWWPLSLAMQAAAQEAALAARSKDRAGLSQASRKLDVACQSCHAHFKVHGQ
jgi:hypothetical protein